MQPHKYRGLYNPVNLEVTCLACAHIIIKIKNTPFYFQFRLLCLLEEGVVVGCPQAKKLSFQIPLLGGVMEVSETRIGGVNLVKPSVSLTFGNLEWKGEGGGSACVLHRARTRLRWAKQDGRVRCTKAFSGARDKGTFTSRHL